MVEANLRCAYDKEANWYYSQMIYYAQNLRVSASRLTCTAIMPTTLKKQVPGNKPATTEKQAVRAQSTQGGTLGVNKEVKHQHNNVRETRRNASW